MANGKPVCIPAKKLNNQNQSSESSSSALGVSPRLPIRKTLPHIYRNFMTSESGVLYAHARFETKKGQPERTFLVFALVMAVVVAEISDPVTVFQIAAG